MTIFKPAARIARPLCLAWALICGWSTFAPAQLTISTPILESAPNFRDLAGISASNGGTGLVNPAGNSGLMRTGVIYRTDELGYLSGADSATIVSLGVKRDIDLRTPSEIQATPDRVPPGLIYTNVNIYGTPSPTPEPAFTSAPQAMIGFMQSGYQGFITDPVQRAAFRTVLLTLASDAFPDLYHCSGGKDRTGWTSAILQSIAGVPRATIFNDYLATNSYTAALIAATRAAIMAQTPGANPATIDALLGVQASYLQTAFDQVAASYGSMDAYLTQGLGLSLADIYVLRARMVSYPVLPGQAALAGNAASGAALLRSLQNSPLSGRYTNYNFYLQSSVDAGTLGGVPAQAGGQVFADAASCLLRAPGRIGEAVALDADGRNVPEGQARAWLAGLGESFRASGASGYAASTELSAGALGGVTYRVNTQASVYAGIGYNSGSVESAGGTATLSTVLATAGARYGFSSLEAGPYLAAGVLAGHVAQQSRRDLASGLGSPTGATTGALYGGQAVLGYALQLGPVSLAPQAGIRVSGVSLGGFTESGGELALGVNAINRTAANLLAGIEASLNERQAGSWTFSPALTLGYERALDSARTDSSASLFGIAVSQQSAFDSADLFKAGLAVTAKNGAFTAKAQANATAGDGAGSFGYGGQISLQYSF